MTKSFSVGLTGRAELAHGAGPRLLVGSVSMGPASEALHAKDFGLHSIYGVYITDHKIGTLLYAYCRNPGTYSNYASIQAWRGSGSAPTAMTSGSHTFRVLVEGE